MAFFTQRATLALSNVRNLQDPTDPTSLALDTESHADFLAQLRFSTHTLTDNQVRRLSDQELQSSVSAFLDLRPDGFALHQKSKRVAILEFTRAMDSSVTGKQRKTLRNAQDTPQCWTSLTRFRRTKDGHYCNSISLSGLEAQSPMWTGLSPSLSCPRSRLWASPRSE